MQVASNKKELFYMEMERKIMNLKENRQLEYLFSVHIILSHTLLPGIYLRRNIPVTDGKNLNLPVDVISAENLKVLL
jgi:hypothetical protein